MDLSKGKGVVGPSIAELEQWSAWVIQERNTSTELSFRWVDEQESADLNFQYRGKSGPTNVLSFGYQDETGVGSAFLGDIVICSALVKKEADAQGKPENHHWAHLVIHGILHLIGYDHDSNAEAAQMELLEIRLLRELGIANPYQRGASTKSHE
ncbi:MAG TPA: rRNA maturation RNase YbeY [Gammaproteobacteria bacterium]|nr:rRNA maturation RNase YbeY [Gammaproteobacteria bacterium]